MSYVRGKLVDSLVTWPRVAQPESTGGTAAVTIPESRSGYRGSSGSRTSPAANTAPLITHRSLIRSSGPLIILPAGLGGPIGKGPDNASARYRGWDPVRFVAVREDWEFLIIRRDMR